MEFLAVLVAAAAAFVFGAAWYMTLSKPWKEVSGVVCDENGTPKNAGDPTPFILSGVAMILVAGVMRHIFASSGIETLGKGIMSGLGIGLFLIVPWMMINNAYPGRPFSLTVIDGGYAVFGCAIIGAILTLF